MCTLWACSRVGVGTATNRLGKKVADWLDSILTKITDLEYCADNADKVHVGYLKITDLEYWFDNEQPGTKITDLEY